MSKLLTTSRLHRVGRMAWHERLDGVSRSVDSGGKEGWSEYVSV
jgi:hypothetical protein